MRKESGQSAVSPILGLSLHLHQESVRVTEHLVLHRHCAHWNHTTKDSLNSLDFHSGCLMDVFITALLDL